MGKNSNNNKKCKCILFYFIFFFLLLGLDLWHIEVPRLVVELELQLLIYTTAHSNNGSLTH